MGTPPMSTKGFPGSRELAYLAGIITTNWGIETGFFDAVKLGVLG